MPDFEFSCPNCSQVLEAPDDMAGQEVECPGCQKPMTVPQPPRKAGAAKPATVSSRGNKCPECGGNLEKDAVLCVACGYHTKLGKKIGTELG